MTRYFIVNEYFGSRFYDSLTKTETYFDINETKKLKQRLKGEFIEINYCKKNEFSSPLKISINITKKCNLNCTQCFTKSGIIIKDELNTSHIFNLFDQMREYGTFFVCLGGGEPLTRVDLLDILEYGNKKQLAVSIVSNGLLLTKEYISKLNETNPDKFWISLDGLRENHERIRGNGTYFKTLESMALLKKHFTGKKAIRVTLNKYNFHEFKHLINIAEEYNFDLIRITPLLSYGRAKNKNLEINQNQYIQFLSEISEIKSNVKIIYPGKEDTTKPWIGTNGFGCHCGKEAMWIDATGECSPCYFWGKEYNIGNIKNEKFINIWDNSLKSSFIDGNPICKTCRIYKQCRGGCRFRSLCVFGNLNEVDPLCPLRKN